MRRNDFIEIFMLLHFRLRVFLQPPLRSSGNTYETDEGCMIVE